jgi:glycosyltransferase involved in cell wall biosynthesis
MVFCIDADERATPELQKRILDLKRNGFTADAYWINRRNWYVTGWLKVGGWYPDRKIRLFDRRKGGWKGEDPHDKVEMRKNARIGWLPSDILHYTYRSLSEHLRQIDGFSTAAAKAKFKKGKKVTAFRLLATPFVSFFKSYFIRRGFMAGKRGIIVSFLSAFSDFAKYAKLWELQIGEKRKDKNG